jgi:hypothetical protein
MSAGAFPSGEWTGFYVYSRNTSRFLMDLALTFSAGRISGSGWDDIGSFEIRGTYCEQSLECSWAKQYHGMHTVDYRGFREGKGIWGTWAVAGQTGGFHIWPIGTGGEVFADTEQVEESVPAPSRR